MVYAATGVVVVRTGTVRSLDPPRSSRVKTFVVALVVVPRCESARDAQRPRSSNRKSIVAGPRVTEALVCDTTCTQEAKQVSVSARDGPNASELT
jgi:hypothetical protein